MKIEVFNVTNRHKDWMGDQFNEVFATRDEAVARAKSDWASLTPSEQSERVIEVWASDAYEEGDEFDELTCAELKLDGRTVYVSSDGYNLEWSSNERFVITASNEGNPPISNVLWNLNGEKFATREEACERIYAVMYDIIDSENGCEMVDKTFVDEKVDEICDGLYVCDASDDNGTGIKIGYTPTELTLRDFILQSGCIQEGYVTDEIANWNEFLEIQNNLTALCDEYVSNAYIDRCHEYILKNGRATEDGVTACVEEAN